MSHVLKICIIFIIRCYQYFYPKKYRGRCRFTPTCSEYMILAIKKYGVIHGLRIGRNRIKRCKYPNFGDDYP